MNVGTLFSRTFAAQLQKQAAAADPSERLKRLAKRRGETQEDLARHCVGVRYLTQAELVEWSKGRGLDDGKLAIVSPEES